MLSSKTLVTRLVVAAICLATTTSVLAQDAAKRFEIALKDDNIATLKSIGSLKAPIKEADRGKLNSVVIGMDSNIKSDPLEVEGISFVGDAAVIAVDDEMIDKMKSNSMRFVSEGENFAKVYLKYIYSAPSTEAISDMVQEPGDAPLEKGPAPDEDAPQEENPSSTAPITQKPSSVDNSQTPGPDDGDEEPEAVDISYINLNNGKTISGEIDGLNEFTMVCKFGKITIAMEHVSGIRFHADGDDNAVVVLNNGDSITGKPTVPAMSLKTDWGVADVEPQFIDSITKAQNARFSQDSTDFGSRWNLKLSPFYQQGFGNQSGFGSGGGGGVINPGSPQIIGE